MRLGKDSDFFTGSVSRERARVLNLLLARAAEQAVNGRKAELQETKDLAYSLISAEDERIEAYFEAAHVKKQYPKKTIADLGSTLVNNATAIRKLFDSLGCSVDEAAAAIAVQKELYQHNPRYATVDAYVEALVDLRSEGQS